MAIECRWRRREHPLLQRGHHDGAAHVSAMLILLPYFNFVFSYLNRSRIVDRISARTLELIAKRAAPGRLGAQARGGARRGAARGRRGQRDGAPRQGCVDCERRRATGQLIVGYQGVREQLPAEWSRWTPSSHATPDFVSLDASALAELGRARLVRDECAAPVPDRVHEALHRMRDITT